MQNLIPLCHTVWARPQNQEVPELHWLGMEIDLALLKHMPLTRAHATIPKLVGLDQTE